MTRGPTRRAIGDAAEAQVDRAARRRGWKRVARNYVARAGELDLVYRNGDALIVVEVRYRSRLDYGSGAESVTPTKQRRIIAATRHLLAARPHLADLAVRFDVVGVDAQQRLDWIEDAFRVT